MVVDRAGDLLRAFDHSMDMVTMCLVPLSDDKHGKLGTVTLEACVKALGVNDVGEVAEVLSGKRVLDPLPVDHLALSKRDIRSVRVLCWNSLELSINVHRQM